ncbi:hypothetical protein MASR2M79_18880 [Aminivibrio sp.]
MRMTFRIEPRLSVPPGLKLLIPLLSRGSSLFRRDFLYFLGVSPLKALLAS